MPDKSPQKPSGKKPGRSLKEKRAAKHDKKDQRSSFASDVSASKAKRP